jgi:uncharacterized Zn finger protein
MIKRTSAALASVALAGLLSAACGSSPAPLSAACKHAVAVQNAYVEWVKTFTTYPYDGVGEGIDILNHDQALLRAGAKVCPGTAKIESLPTG